MMHPHRLCIWLMIPLLIFSMVACNQQTKRRNVKKQQTRQSAGKMRIAFYHPIVMVNGKRSQKRGDVFQQWIELSYPQNSVHNIDLTVLTPQGEEKQLHGKIEIGKYTQYSKPQGEKGDLIKIAPANAEYTYESILRNGYGELAVRESVSSIETEELKKGPILVTLKLGTKKKSDNKIVEFRFREGVVHSVQGKKAPVSLFFSENSRHRFKLAIDEGSLQLQGILTVEKGNYYTALAPVWIILDDKIKDYLRGRGGRATLALYVPAFKKQKDENIVTSVSYEEKPELIAQRNGTLIALLQLRRTK